MKKFFSIILTTALLFSVGAIGVSATTVKAKIANPVLSYVNRNPDPASDDTVLFAVLEFDVSEAGSITITTSRKICNVYVLNNGREVNLTQSKNGKVFTVNAKKGTLSISLIDWPTGFTMPFVTIQNYEFYKGYITAKLGSAKVIAETNKNNVYTTTIQIKANTNGKLWLSSNVKIKSVSGTAVNMTSWNRMISANTTYTFSIITQGKPNWFKANGIVF